MADADAARANDEEFYAAVYRGSDLLGKGQLGQAREALEVALAVRPDDAKARNLMGLTCFKLGDFESAERIYQELVHENPADPTLRVNLGLVYLKAGRFEEAIRELSVATDLEPAHQRAQNYLGLAHARVGDYAQARECFALAGSEQMVEQMDRALSGETDPPLSMSGDERSADAFGAEVDLDGEDEDEEVVAEIPADELGAAVDAAAPPAVTLRGSEATEELEEIDAVEQLPDEDDDEPLEADPPPAEEPEPVAAAPASSAEEPEPVAAAPVSSAEEREPVAAVSAAPSPAPAGARPVPVAAPPSLSPIPAPVAAEVEISEWRTARKLIDEAERLNLSFPDGAVFAVGGGLLAARVDDELLIRLAGLVAATGSLELQPENKRFHGRKTDKGFGDGAHRMMRISGDGRLLLSAADAGYVVLDLDGADGYFQEAAVIAFQETVGYENGRVPSTVSADLNLVHLRGEGSVVVRLEGELASLDVTREAPVRIPMPRLVGWHGGLTPRIVVLADVGGEDGGPMVAVELVGDGVALVTRPA